MDWKMSRGSGLVALLMTGALLALVPAAALAQECAGNTASGALLEVMESPPALAAPGGPYVAGAFSPGMGLQLNAFVARIAEATEVGDLVGCGSLSGLSGSIDVHAQSRIPVTVDGQLGTGTISGVFQVQGASGTTAGSLAGYLSFIPGAPLAVAQGQWSTLGRNRTGGGFSGVAYVPVNPFLDDLLSCNSETGCFYYDPIGFLGGGLIPLTPDEYSKQFGNGLAKFVIKLYQ